MSRRRYQFKHSSPFHVAPSGCFRRRRQRRGTQRGWEGKSGGRRRNPPCARSERDGRRGCTSTVLRTYPAAVRRWKKVGRLRERRRRPKASRIAPGTVPKYRTELARPHCRIRLPACQVARVRRTGERTHAHTLWCLVASRFSPDSLAIHARQVFARSTVYDNAAGAGTSATSQRTRCTRPTRTRNFGEPSRADVFPAPHDARPPLVHDTC